MKVIALALLLLGGCSEKTDLFSPLGDGGTCAEPGPPIQLSVSYPCSGAMAAHLLRYALCSCTALILERGLFSEGGTRPMDPPAAIGTDDYVQVAGPVQVAGSLHAAGINGATFSRTAAVLGSLRSGGPLLANQFLAVGGDAYVGGDVLGRIDIAGDLHVPGNALIAASVSAGGLVVEPVKVALPCNCAARPPFDAAALLMLRAGENDNAQISLGRDALANGGPAVIDLPCGQYYFSSVNEPLGVELELRVHGRVGLFVAGNVNTGKGLRVTLDAGAELDVIIGGNLIVPAGAVGAPSAEAVRVWLAGSVLKLGQGSLLSAAVYAPNAVVLSDGDLNVRGALLAQSLSVPGDIAVHFDADLLDEGASCGAPAEPPVQ